MQLEPHGMEKTVKELGWGANLNLVVPVGTEVGWDIVDYADNNGVLISIANPYENPEKQGEFMFSKPIMVSNKFSPALKDAFDSASKFVDFMKGQYNEGIPLEGQPARIPFTKENH